MTRSLFALLALSSALVLLVSCDDGAELLGPKPPAGALRFVDIDVGYLHACGLRASGSVFCWGRNATGALGNGTNERALAPTQVITPQDFVELESGAAHNCGLTEEGTAYCWGHNDEGQVGDGSFLTRPFPTEVSGNHEFVAISVGHAHACGIDTEGEAWCWGDDLHGQLGNGPSGATSKSAVPVEVSHPDPFRAISAGFYQTCALTVEGAAWCWGHNYVGQNGDGTFDERHAPVAVGGGLTFDTIATGDGVVCGLDDRDLYCWGSNRFFELAREPVDIAMEPALVDIGEMRQVAPASGAETIGGARPYICGVGANRRALCWGGAVDGLRAAGPEPTVLDGSIEMTTLASGPQFVCGLRSDGYAYCAGVGNSGQLGNGDVEDRASMTPVGAPD